MPENREAPVGWRARRARNVAQPSPAASSRTVPVRAAQAGGGTPPSLAGEDACATDLTGADDTRRLIAGFHFRGVLPHLKREGGTYFATFRQAGTLPKEMLLRFRIEHEAIIKQAQAAKRPLTWHEQEELFRWYSNRVDKYLDADHGTGALRDPKLASLVAETIRFFEGQRYVVHASVVMPNHAHVVVRPMPGWTLSAILHSWKSYTSHEINKYLPTKIVPFWQPESYEHLIRDDEDLYRCCHYTLINPVQAGLCARPQDWEWSSAHVAQPSPAASSRTVPVRAARKGGETPP